MRDPRRLPPSIWFMEGDPDDDALLPPPKAVAKAKAKPRTARAQARMMSALLRISWANRARAAAVATKTGAADPPLPRELYQPAEPCCWSVLSNGSGLESTLPDGVAGARQSVEPASTRLQTHALELG